jgi:hypothetical protein
VEKKFSRSLEEVFLLFQWLVNSCLGACCQKMNGLLVAELTEIREKLLFIIILQ